MATIKKFTKAQLETVLSVIHSSLKNMVENGDKLSSNLQSLIVHKEMTSIKALVNESIKAYQKTQETVKALNKSLKATIRLKLEQTTKLKGKALDDKTIKLFNEQKTKASEGEYGILRKAIPAAYRAVDLGYAKVSTKGIEFSKVPFVPVPVKAKKGNKKGDTNLPIVDIEVTNTAAFDAMEALRKADFKLWSLMVNTLLDQRNTFNDQAQTASLKAVGE